MANSKQRTRRGAAVAAVFVLLACGAALQWRRSQSHFDSLRWQGFVAMTAEGKLCVLHSTLVPRGPVRGVFHSVPHHRGDKGSAIVQWPSFGFTWPTDPATGERKLELTVVTPLWLVGALCAVPPAWWLFRGRHAARLADEMD